MVDIAVFVVGATLFALYLGLIIHTWWGEVTHEAQMRTREALESEPPVDSDLYLRQQFEELEREVARRESKQVIRRRLKM